jgi:hypothetical protein
VQVQQMQIDNSAKKENKQLARAMQTSTQMTKGGKKPR